MTFAQAAVALVVLVPACEWDLNRMTDQARCEPGDRRPWLADDRCDQSPPEGTIAWREPPSSAPPAPTRELILRGRDRFDRFCVPCHGQLADGNSAVARDMMLRRPPSLLDPVVRELTDERIVRVIDTGYGAMPAYGTRIALVDRWAILHYVRVLQQSQQMPLADLSTARREEAMRWLR